jgi:AGCS family alanine or glycine:cation symporter
MIIAISSAAILLSFELKFFQFAYFGTIFKQTFGSIFKKSKGEGSISSFQAACTALAATVGGGNISGVAVAVSYGGPGAIFWMWVIAIIACIAKYAEITLAIKYREFDKESGEYRSGLMYVLKNSLNWKGLAVIWALVFGITQLAAPALQASAITATVNTSFGVDKLLVGIVLVVISGLVLFGGIKWIGRFAEICVPFMSILYLLGAVWIVGMNLKEIPGVLGTICWHAFNPAAAGGGFAGASVMLALRNGFARGIYSNEAGMGTSPMAHATAITDMPARQAMWGVAEVFVDTIILCTLSAMVILVSGVMQTAPELGPHLTALAFNSQLGMIGSTIVTVCMILFGISTLLVNCYYCENGFAFVFKGNRATIYVVRLLTLGMAVYGSAGHYLGVWNLYDFFMGMTVFINVICLAIMRKDVRVETDRLIETLAAEKKAKQA